MRRRICLILAWLLTLSATELQAEIAQEFRAQQGVMNLSGRPVTQPLALAGEWRFAWQQLSDGSGSHDWPLFTMPSTWDENGQAGYEYPGQGYATFVLDIQGLDPQVDWALFVPEIATSFRLLANGRDILHGGRVGTSRQEVQPYQGNRWVRLGGIADGRLQLVLQVANYHHHSAGPWQPLLLGPEDQITRGYAQHVIYEAVILLLLLLIGLLLVMEYTVDRKDRTGLWLGLFTLMLGVRLGTTSFAPLYWMLSLNPPWELHIRVIYISMLVSPVLLFGWLHAAFGTDFSRSLRNLFSLPFLLAALLCLLLPPLWFTALLGIFGGLLLLGVVVSTLALLRMVYLGRRGAWLILPGTMLLGVAVIHDVLLNNQLLSGQYWSPLGFLIFIVSMICNFLLNRVWSRQEIVRLSEELRLINRELEQRVAERTQALAEKANALLDANQQLQVLADVDGLTGLLNRRALLEQLQQLKQWQGSVAVLWIDLDHFKRINDGFGHAAGDAVLAAFGALLRRLGRDRDRLARLGGEEFAVLLLDCGAEGAETFARRLQQQLRELQVPDWPQIHNLSASTGIAVGRLGETDGEELLNAADQAMYEVKHSTRDGYKIAADYRR
ncbi:sensor domain-containing diguanylate cyclase [Thalassolituus alkanivorans]|uniref:sensor domain-containing diguanylate cyclase n=1 Tax=Thalassolituus alkanivorans TaxID=2881055 RepID=UPI001E494CAE|nr:diguanylate cyclase [Thalassolituus alkanivorans]MCB2388003.1 diguanylate cyclase [Thalassolituus alkanivorans]MCB2424804.1 diguanylate cyclase [Thalassolituus alkanivorans]